MQVEFTVDSHLLKAFAHLCTVSCWVLPKIQHKSRLGLASFFPLSWKSCFGGDGPGDPRGFSEAFCMFVPLRILGAEMQESEKKKQVEKLLETTSEHRRTCRCNLRWVLALIAGAQQAAEPWGFPSADSARGGARDRKPDYSILTLAVCSPRSVLAAPSTSETQGTALGVGFSARCLGCYINYWWFFLPHWCAGWVSVATWEGLFATSLRSCRTFIVYPAPFTLLLCFLWLWIYWGGGFRRWRS